MTERATCILFVDDRPERFEWFCEQLDELARRQPSVGISSADVVYARSGPEALARVERDDAPVLVAVVDLDFSRLPPDVPLWGPDARREGLDIARRLCAAAPGLPVYLFTLAEAELGVSEPQIHVVPADALIRRNVVAVAFEMVAQRNALERDAMLEHELPPSLRSVPGIDALRRLSRGAMPLLLIGEPGTGKTQLAAWIHRASARAGAFEKFDCAQWPGGDPNLMKAALFGQAKGVVPGAAERLGACARAQAGTLFLDEVAELPAELQAMLLGALDPPHEYSPLGAESHPREASFRLVSATNRKLEELDDRLRRDFFDRLGAAHPIELLPLRERPGDIAWFVAREMASINAARARSGRRHLHVDDAAARALEAADWPGNARELRLTLERAAAFAGDGAVLRADHLPKEVRPRSSGAPLPLPEPGRIELSLGEPLERAVCRYLVATWRHSGYDAPRAAEQARIGRATLWRALRAVGIELLARVVLDGESEADTAAASGLTLEEAARLRSDAEDYLRKLGDRPIDLQAKAAELRLDAALLERLMSQLGQSRRG